MKRGKGLAPRLDQDADEIDDRVLHGDLDLLAFVGALSLVKSGQDSDCGVKAAA